MLRRVLDRVFGNVRSGETKLVNAVSFVVRDVERVGSACINLVRVLAHRHVESGCGLSRDHGGSSVGADNVPVVLEVREIDPGIIAEREINAVFKRISEALCQPRSVGIRFGRGNGDLRRIVLYRSLCA